MGWPPTGRRTPPTPPHWLPNPSIHIGSAHTHSTPPPLTHGCLEKPPVIPLMLDPSIHKDRPTAVFFENEIQTLTQPFSYSIIALMWIAKIIGKSLYVDEATANGSRPSVAQAMENASNVTIQKHKKMRCRKLAERMEKSVIKGGGLVLSDESQPDESEVRPLSASCMHEGTLGSSDESGFNKENSLVPSHTDVSHANLEVHPMVLYRSKRVPLWDCVRTVSAGIEGPWLARGDFNVILNRTEKLHGATPHGGLMEDFATTLLDCGLLNGGFEGKPYTWTNSHML
ncbi:Uncharacterized protein TCM_022852 [Theobroma cacao]|uniref:Uncharacterized protein n=1 Tax=Theobroma cacao TaxID=3641 RepID=A0A061EVI2_THECC|nr:Uncharacterized protein TCM_022852 [Theobroma cacao]